MTTDQESGPQRWVMVFETTDVSLLMLVKSVLEDAGIDYTVQGEEASTLLPLGPFGAGLSRHGFAARIHVPEDQASDAEEVLAVLDEETEEDAGADD
ncbi:MAG: DUF2007 domain-containing protein [Acidobacteriota bacterium]|nr:DUF2007 domain-containing protein [Acidobacteriota bacterium]